MPPLDERGRVDLRDIALKIDRIYVALFEEVAGNPSLFTRVRILEQTTLSLVERIEDDETEKKANRIVAAIGTTIGATVGAAAAVITMLQGGHRP